MTLILPNDIANGQPADGDRLQQNYATIESFLNQETITRDGSTAMIQPLLLAGPPTQPNQAATKEYVDQGGQVTTWAGLPYVTNWAGTAMYRKVADVVAVQGSVVWNGGSGADGPRVICQLPVGFRPAYLRRFTAWDNNSGVARRVTADTNGQIYIDSPVNAVHSFDLDISFSTTL